MINDYRQRAPRPGNLVCWRACLDDVVVWSFFHAVKMAGHDNDFLRKLVALSPFGQSPNWKEAEKIENIGYRNLLAPSDHNVLHEQQVCDPDCQFGTTVCILAEWMGEVAGTFVSLPGKDIGLT